MDMPLPDLTHPASSKLSRDMRNLIWLLQSENLLHAHPSGIEQLVNLKPSREFISRIHSSDFENLLSKNLADLKSGFLGSYFEALYAFYLKHEPCYEIAAQNLQIHENGKTIGEFDFIVLDKRFDQHVHHELAIKFYLGVPQHQAHLWIGPQSVDRLDLKIEKLRQQQLNLANHPSAQKRLAQLGIEVVASQALVKGFLFKPEYPPGVSIPPYINPAHLKGNWLKPSELAHYQHRLGEDAEKSFWMRLDKRNWLAPQCFAIDAREHSSPMPWNILCEKLDTGTLMENRPIQLARLGKHSSHWLEEERLFIVPEDWPRLTKPPPAL